MKLEAGKWYLNENGGKRYVASTCALGPQPVIVQEELTYFLMAGIPSAIPCMGAQSGPHTTYRFHLHNADGTPSSEADRKAGYSLVRECFAHPPKPPLMHNKIAIATIVMIAAAFTGCANLTPEQRDNGNAALKAYLGQKVTGLATSLITNAAKSYFDKSKKADLLDSAAQGLRTELTAVDQNDFTSIANIVKAYTAPKAHWDTLATQVAKTIVNTPGKPAEKVEVAAQALNTAAAQARAGA